MSTSIQELKKKPALAELLLVLMANQNTYMSTVDLLRNGILSPAAGIARLKQQALFTSLHRSQSMWIQAHQAIEPKKPKCVRGNGASPSPRGQGSCHGLCLLKLQRVRGGF